jgi:ribonuclease HII
LSSSFIPYSSSLVDWWVEERAAYDAGYRCIAGIDEAGRGPLAGPVVAACVVLPFERVPHGVQDSKTLTPDQREILFDLILHTARAVGIGRVDALRIDEINILQATHEAMRQAVAALPAGMTPDLVLIDGRPVRPFPIDQVALVKGDARSASVAAASIIAKVTRDRIMTAYDTDYPQYGFASHKGYPTPPHIKALREHGVCPLHRRSYKPVRDALSARMETP